MQSTLFLFHSTYLSLYLSQLYPNARMEIEKKIEYSRVASPRFIQIDLPVLNIHEKRYVTLCPFLMLRLHSHTSLRQNFASAILK